MIVSKEKHFFSKNEIIYHILIDRFAGYNKKKNWEKPEFIGGNLKAITQKIPYLKNLGITTIWISPFYKTSMYHGYHITYFFSVDPHFGKKSDLKNLIDQIHENNMKIIADFVPNHCSKYHPFFIEAQKNKNSTYRNWFYFKNWPDSYLSFLSFPEIPKLNLDNQETFNHIEDAAEYWLSLGLDGYRLDHVIGPSHRFWKRFCSKIKKNFPHIILIGEAWMAGIKYHELQTLNMKNKRLLWFLGNSSTTLLQSYTKLLDGVLDFQAQQFIKHFIIEYQKNNLIPIHKILKKHYSKFPNSYLLPLFLDNHDMDRFLFFCKNKKSLLKKAAEIQFPSKQPIIIYYGTEIGMTQEKSIWSTHSHGDIQARQPMQWDNIDESLLLFYQQLCQNRLMR